MKQNAVALVSRADKARVQITRYLRNSGYEVFECEELSIPGRFAGVVVVDDQESDLARSRVQSWMKLPMPPRVVVISSKPAGWKALSLAHNDHVFVLAGPAFGWEIVDVLRMAPPEPPRRV